MPACDRRVSDGSQVVGVFVRMDKVRLGPIVYEFPAQPPR